MVQTLSFASSVSIFRMFNRPRFLLLMDPPFLDAVHAYARERQQDSGKEPVGIAGGRIGQAFPSFIGRLPLPVSVLVSAFLASRNRRGVFVRFSGSFENRVSA
jgi:hypothetical protein